MRDWNYAREWDNSLRRYLASDLRHYTRSREDGMDEAANAIRLAIYVLSYGVWSVVSVKERPSHNPVTRCWVNTDHGATKGIVDQTSSMTSNVNKMNNKLMVSSIYLSSFNFGVARHNQSLYCLRTTSCRQSIQRRIVDAVIDDKRTR
ncbi:hypothetical protein K449DRAFT_429893 [Hypoxylon sp. EC38]|nr:hypothetical protein K449DRAFT_429893 [Hypoxylon sp. EC38]